MESLHHYGLLRVVQRRDGIRIYEVVPPPAIAAQAAERARYLVMGVARILALVSAVTLRGALALMARRNPGVGRLAPVIFTALRTGELEQEEIDGKTYLWPALDADWRHRPAPRDVRLLAPFDPVVWLLCNAPVVERQGHWLGEREAGCRKVAGRGRLRSTLPTNPRVSARPSCRVGTDGAVSNKSRVCTPCSRDAGTDTMRPA